MKGKIRYAFSGRTWQHTSPTGWHFVALPVELSGEIRKNLKWQEEGWGRLKAKARVGNTEWETAIWFDTKRNAYLLPLKAEIRRKEKIVANRDISVTVWI